MAVPWSLSMLPAKFGFGRVKLFQVRIDRLIAGPQQATGEHVEKDRVGQFLVVMADGGAKHPALAIGVGPHAHLIVFGFLAFGGG